MRARDAILLVLLGVVLTLSVAGYLFYEHAQKSSKSTARVTTQPSKQQNTMQTPTNAREEEASSDGMNLQVMGTNNSQPQSSNTATLPKPEEFDVYNQYVNNESAMYAEIKIGTGEEAKPNDTAAMLYKGWLTDGQLFDQTKANEEGKLVTFNFTIGGGQVIRGWDQGIVGMKVGGKRRLIIPPALGYGETGTGPIPPNAVLVFDVELIAINPQ